MPAQDNRLDSADIEIIATPHLKVVGWTASPSPLEIRQAKAQAKLAENFLCALYARWNARGYAGPPKDS